MMGLGDDLSGRFVTLKRISVEDRRLAYLNAFFKMLVVAYVVVWQICALHQYALFESVSAYGNVWYGLLANISTTKNHCNNPVYDWGTNFSPELKLLTGNLSAENLSCTEFDRSKHVTIDSNSFVAVTCEMHTFENGTTRNYFTDAPERAVMNVIHGFTASFLRNGLMNPVTVLSSKTGTHLRSFQADQILGPISMADVLEMADINLETRNLQPWFGTNPDLSPFFRLSGVVLLMRITYSNFRDYEFPNSIRSGDPRARVTVEHLPTAWGFLGGEVRIDEVSGRPYNVQRTGIKVQLVFSGQVGQFDFIQLIRRLVEAVVLLGVAAVGTELVARWILHRRTYESLACEPIPYALLTGPPAAPTHHTDCDDDDGSSFPPKSDLRSGGGGVAARSPQPASMVHQLVINNIQPTVAPSQAAPTPAPPLLPAPTPTTDIAAVAAEGHDPRAGRAVHVHGGGIQNGTSNHGGIGLGGGGGGGGGDTQPRRGGKRRVSSPGLASWLAAGDVGPRLHPHFRGDGSSSSSVVGAGDVGTGGWGPQGAGGAGYRNGVGSGGGGAGGGGAVVGLHISSAPRGAPPWAPAWSKAAPAWSRGGGSPGWRWNVPAPAPASLINGGVRGMC